jgi:hypothetical protein
MSPVTQNMITGPDVRGSSNNEPGSIKLENGTRRPRYRGKRLRERKTSKRDLTSSFPPKMSPGAQNMKTGPDTLGTAKQENGAHSPRDRRK